MNAIKTFMQLKKSLSVLKRFVLAVNTGGG